MSMMNLMSGGNTMSNAAVTVDGSGLLLSDEDGNNRMNEVVCYLCGRNYSKDVVKP